jgi:hypothetical protein
MTEPTAREAGNDISAESKLQLLFLGVLSISFVGYFALRELWISWAFMAAWQVL